MKRTKTPKPSIVGTMQNQGGRPSSFKPEYIEHVFNFALLGATEKEMAVVFGVTLETLENWKDAIPEFFQSLKEGREIADGRVAKSLFRRAVGYSHPDIHISTCRWEDKNGKSHVKVIKTPIMKHYPPDVGAGKLFLNVRRRGKGIDPQSLNWTEVSQKEMTGKDGRPLIPKNTSVAHEHKIDTSNLTNEQLQALITLAGSRDAMEEIDIDGIDD